MNQGSGLSNGAAAAEGFSRKAGLYDAFGQDHPNLERMRARVRAHVHGLAPAGGRLLELNAGTGGDAAYFAQAGWSVLATDIAPGMLAAIGEKIRAQGLAGRLQVQQHSFTELDRLNAGRFDHVFSNMGGLNCVPDLAAVTRHLPAVLKPGGFATFVIMPRICPWEWLALLRGDTRTAFRRLRPGGVLANVEGVAVPTYYFSSRQAQSAFGAPFRRVRLEHLSLFTPPADHKGFAHRHPRLFRLLTGLDERTARLPLLRGWGDFFILSMQLLP